MTCRQKVIANSVDSCIMFTERGISAVGAHHTGSVGVTGSNPVCSTKNRLLSVKAKGGFLCTVEQLTVPDGTLLFHFLSERNHM